MRANARRFNTYVAGRRHFKSTFLSVLAVEAALAGTQVLVGAPTYDQVRLLFANAQRMLGDTGTFNISRMECVLPTGGTIMFRSLDLPNNVRGHTAGLVLIDEAGYCKAEGWYEVLRPMLFTTGGSAWLAGTPVGRNWFFDEFMKKGKDRATFQAPTVGCKIVDGELKRKKHPLENPNIPFEEIQEYFSTVPLQVFNQEILATFTEDLSTVFRNVRGCATATEQMDPLPLHSYVMGVDWGKLNDYTVLSVIDTLTNELVTKERFNMIGYEIQLDRLLRLYNRFHPTTMVCEANSMGEPLCDLLESKGIPVDRFSTTQSSKAKVIDDLALAFERNEIKILNDETLIGELVAYELERLPSGKFRYSAPPNLHDDCVISLALAWWAANESNQTASWLGPNPVEGYRG